MIDLYAPVFNALRPLFSSGIFKQVLFTEQLILAELLFSTLLERRRHFWLRWCLVILVYPVLVMPVALLAEALYPAAMLMLISLFSMLILPFCVKVNFWSDLFCCVAAIVTQNLAYSAGTLASTLLGVYPVSAVNPVTALIQTPVYLAVQAVVFLLCARQMRGGIAITIERATAFFLALFCAVVIYIVQYYALPIPGNSSFIMFKVIFISCDVMSLFVLFGIHKQSKLREENSTLLQVMAAKSEQYELSQHSVDLVNMKCHDLKHQIDMLRQVSSSDQARYLNELEETLQIYDSVASTGSREMDAVLTNKFAVCRKYGITLTYLVDGARLDFISPVDIYSLFGNALDNAIEAVKDIDPEKRVILLNATVRGGFLAVHAENYCEKELSFEGGLPATTKGDTEYHGFGLKSIRYIAEKYHGAMTVSQQDKMFCVDILLPIPSTAE